MTALDPELAGAPAAERQDDLLPKVQQVVGLEFEVVGMLGRGGMANVYLAHDRVLSRMVALKVLHPLVLSSSTMRERFLREARVAAALGHRNVVPIHGLREGQGIIVLVLRAIMGRPLSAILADEGALPVPLVQRIVAQTAGALDFSHSHGVIHRDIKPGNILIDEDGTVSVSDFGIAKALEDPNLTSTGSTIGTPAYMSPEQCDGTPVTPAADQYALGAVAYEMLTGRTPFGADTAMGLMYAQTHHTPAPLRELRPDVPVQLAEAVERMLQKEAEARWPTLDEMVRHAGRPTVEGLVDPVADELGRLARRESPGLQLAAAFTKSPTPGRLSDPDAPTVIFSPERGWGRWIVAATLLVAAATTFLLGNETPPATATTESTASARRTVAEPVTAPGAGTAPRPQPSRPAAATAATTVVDPRTDTAAARREVQRTVLRFTRAVEARDLAQTISAVPSLTPEDQSFWEELFGRAPAIRFDVSIGRIDWEERGAEAELRGFIAYTPTGKTDRKVDSWNRRADMALGPTGWRIVRFR